MPHTSAVLGSCSTPDYPAKVAKAQPQVILITTSKTLHVL